MDIPKPEQSLLESDFLIAPLTIGRSPVLVQAVLVIAYPYFIETSAGLNAS
jgi:hypothetical protein